MKTIQPTMSIALWWPSCFVCVSRKHALV